MGELADVSVVGMAGGESRSEVFRRFVVVLTLCGLLPSAAVAAAVMAVDPYYVFGTPDWRINAVRPHYENRVLIAKPYQVARMRPEAASFGSSRVEVGLDPRHPGWASAHVFNYALPASNSYAVMLAFLDAQRHGMKRAVVGLDFFGYNINFPLGADLAEERFTGVDLQEFIDYLGERGKVASRAVTPARGDIADAWNEQLYLAVNGDVAAAVARREFASGRQHYELAGRREGRRGATTPTDWNEQAYLQAHPDVATAVANRVFISGYHHYLAAGRVEGRLGGLQPANWDDASYLAHNPSAHVRIALGYYASAFVHYAGTGRKQGLIGGTPPADQLEAMRLAWPAIDRHVRVARELLSFVFSISAISDAVTTTRSQNEPAQFDGLGMRVWHGHEDVVRNLGGPGRLFANALQAGALQPTLVPPTYIHCFSNPQTRVSTFDSYRFMLRRAYAEGTDLRLFVTPLNIAVRAMLVAAGLGERYDSWRRELTRINEDEAVRAGRPPLPLWDFSDVNTITQDPMPAADDRSLMRWFWEQSHYRKETGDLILDRIFDYRSQDRTVPADFGTRLTGPTLEAHLAHDREALDTWNARNAALASRVAQSVRDNRTYNRQSEATCW